MTSWVSFLFSSSSLLFLTHVRPSPSRVKWLPPGVQTIHWALYFLSSRCFRSVFKTFLPRFLLSFVHSFFFMSVCDVQRYVYSCVQPSTHIADTTRAFAQVFMWFYLIFLASLFFFFFLFTSANKILATQQPHHVTFTVTHVLRKRYPMPPRRSCLKARQWAMPSSHSIIIWFQSFGLLMFAVVVCCAWSVQSV